MRFRSSLLATITAVSLVAAICAACGDLKDANDASDAAPESGSDNDGSSGGPGPTGDAANDSSVIDAARADGGDAAFPDGKGPGPFGSLPSGYCCTADSECRYRHCVDTGAGGHMCLDECGQDAFCTRPDITFTCAAGPSPRLCAPSAGFTCLAAAGFTRGAKPLGACCSAGSAETNDGTAGSDCEGNQCASTDANPLVCTQRCSFQSDCASDAGSTGFECVQFGSSKACVPTAATYTCF